MFVTTADASQTGTIYEFAHGGTTPIAMLSDPGLPAGCAVDPETGDLAVSNKLDKGNPSGPYQGDIAIYPGAAGSPIMLHASEIGTLFYCGYDGSGNLYTDGVDDVSGKKVLFEVAKGSESIEEVALDFSVQEPGAIQWDGRYMTMGIYAPKVPALINRLQITDGSATAVSTTKLKTAQNKHGGQSWIEDGRVLGISYLNRSSSIAVWKYPRGGMSVAKLPNAGNAIVGLTVSRAPGLK